MTLRYMMRVGRENEEAGQRGSRQYKQKKRRGLYMEHIFAVASDAGDNE